MKDKESKWMLIIMFLPVIGFVVFMIWFMPTMEGMLGVGSGMEKCNKYTNITGDGQYMFGKCYFQEYDYYETKEVCRGGFIGIGQACYESSETHYERYTTTKCIVADTGERC